MLRSIIPTSRCSSISIVSKRFLAAAATTTPTSGNTLKFQFALPHEVLVDGKTVKQVNLPVRSGQIGILANHVPITEQLDPGLIEVFEEGQNDPTKYFVSGGFASMQPDSTLCVTSVEAFPLESFSKDKISSLLAEAKKISESKEGKEAAEAAIQVEVLQKLQSALK
ncbi:hypothetical protein TBLA_0G00770 [Henningerozyma blattae CBS 6284]|uniref:ATP synthase subunit delta, mitochondrial n=1 Tax=Henningerozyma blattae (strain ATCC 34711 / CBS 6284 / DSM 70876 / NBRC 10599 / NRRL Y-10934 / UCD 77-7) TaxID=1071380 RepID=I2H6M2_HENB6|nr:hypothetical protein TBLA_0G00770 [Tetrapisispora blattae CBS 6284]CCH62024.1 hypothetical protein TBLA_0G00770 [Tetrapisispora blattae CBS 6284]